jgi:RNA polymerase sigma-70 factor (ECF subfamily)
MNRGEVVRVSEMEVGPGEESAVRHHDAITALIHTHEAPLYRFLVALTANREIALDCVQDTFIRAYEHLQRGKRVNTQWLYKVARNRAIDELRRHRRETPDNEALSRIGLPATDEDMAGLRAAFAALAPPDRAILALSAVEGLSGDEIALRLGIRHGAVRTRLHRARERFRRLYEGGTP